MQEKNPKNYVTWIENKVTLVFDKNKYINTISNEIIQVLNNTNEYDNAKDKILSNLSNLSNSPQNFLKIPYYLEIVSSNNS